MTELNPCNKCGCLHTILRSNVRKDKHILQCASCNHQPVTTFMPMEQAKGAWNDANPTPEEGGMK